MYDPDSSAKIVRLEAIVVIALSALGLWNRLRCRRLISATGGLYTNALLFMGVGPMVHTYNLEVGDLAPFSDLMNALVRPLGWFSLGYVVWCIYDYRKLNSPTLRLRPTADMRSLHLGILLVVALVAMMAHLASGLEFTRSSVGTIVPVLESLLYPAILASMIRWRKRDTPSTVLALSLLSVSVYLAFFSAWRSQLVVLGACAMLTLSLKYKRGLAYGLVLAPVIVFVVLPFQFLKRNNYDMFNGNAGLFISAALQIPWADRKASVAEFMGVRINTAREMSYVQLALDTGNFNSRMGEGYLDTVEQLIPRIFWTDKPSFTDYTNKVLPHLVGLVSDDDDYTSWGVGLWAEFLMNFSACYLPVFVFLVFLLTFQLDRWVSHRFRHPTFLWLTHAALYFLFLSAVSAVTLFPILLWTMLVLFMTDRLATRFLIKPQFSRPFSELSRPSSKMHEGLALRRH